MVPLHVWLPRAHPAAPSHVSALMSGAMIKLGVYGVLRIGLDLLGGGPAWWGALLIGLGALSAVVGMLYALMENDLKRLLAYSSVENVGLVFIGVGAGALFSSFGAGAAATLALSAQSIEYRSEIVPWFERYLYAPVIARLKLWAGRTLAIQSGSAHAYLTSLVIALPALLSMLLVQAT